MLNLYLGHCSLLCVAAMYLCCTISSCLLATKLNFTHGIIGYSVALCATGLVAVANIPYQSKKCNIPQRQVCEGDGRLMQLESIVLDSYLQSSARIVVYIQMPVRFYIHRKCFLVVIRMFPGPALLSVACSNPLPLPYCKRRKAGLVSFPDPPHHAPSENWRSWAGSWNEATVLYIVM